MTTREKAHALLDELSDAELDEFVELRRLQKEEPAEQEPEMAELPEAWKYLPSGEPAPNYVALLDEVRGIR